MPPRLTRAALRNNPNGEQLSPPLGRTRRPRKKRLDYFKFNTPAATPENSIKGTPEPSSNSGSRVNSQVESTESSPISILSVNSQVESTGPSSVSNPSITSEEKSPKERNMPPRKASSRGESVKSKKSQEWEKDSDDEGEEEEGDFGDFDRKDSEEMKRAEEEANEKALRKRVKRVEQLEKGGKTVLNTMETGEQKRTSGWRFSGKKTADQDTTETENEGQKKLKVGILVAKRNKEKLRKAAEEKARQDKRDEEAKKDKEREQDRENSLEIPESEQGSVHTQVSEHTRVSEDKMGRLDREKRDKQATKGKRTTTGMTVDELHDEYNRDVKEIHEKDIPAIQNTIQGFADLNKEIEDFGKRDDYMAMMALAKASLEKDGKYIPLAYEEYRGAMPFDVDADGNPRRTMLLKLKDDFEENDEAAMKKMKKRIEDLKMELENDRNNDKKYRELQQIQQAELERAKKKVKRLEAEVRGIDRTANDKWAAEIKAKNEEIAKLRERQKEMMEELQKYQEKERGG